MQIYELQMIYDIKLCDLHPASKFKINNMALLLIVFPL